MNKVSKKNLQTNAISNDPYHDCSLNVLNFIMRLTGFTAEPSQTSSNSFGAHLLVLSKTIYLFTDYWP